jgi:carotenoid cleavage dioxygenase-like enzyme
VSSLIVSSQRAHASLPDGGRPGTDVCIFDARRVADGPICSIKLPAFSGMTIHVSWVGA